MITILEARTGAELERHADLVTALRVVKRKWLDRTVHVVRASDGALLGRRLPLSAASIEWWAS